MNELIKISSNENDEQVVSARELHKGLGLKKRFSIWWEQNSKLLIENEDFTSVLSGTVVNNGAKRQLQDYALTIDTAKHLAMQSQTEKGYSKSAVKKLNKLDVIEADKKATQIYIQVVKEFAIKYQVELA